MTSHPRTVWLWIAGLVLAIAVYVLSFGPAQWVAVRYRSTVPILQIAYRPIGIVCSKSPLCRKVLVSYLRLWVEI